MTDIYNLFKFIESNRPEYLAPLKFKLLYDPESITKKDLKVRHHLSLYGTQITSLPDGLKVKGYIDLRGTQITSLPEGLTVGRDLDLSDTSITSLPDGLTVGHSLSLTNTKITSLPNNLTIGGSLYLRGTQLSKRYSKDEISKMIQDKGGNVKGNIYI